MSPLVTFPYQLEDGVDLALGSEVLANLEALKNVLHGINYQNLAPMPNFPGTCISSTAGSRLPSDRIEDDAVTAAKLADAANDVDDALRAVTSDHLRLLSVKKKHLALGVLTGAQLDISNAAYSGSITFNPSNALVGIFVSGASVSSGNIVINIVALGLSGSVMIGTQGTLLPSSPTLPAANYVVLNAYVDPTTVSDTGPTYSFTYHVVALKIA